jgi:cytochrome P450
MEAVTLGHPMLPGAGYDFLSPMLGPGSVFVQDGVTHLAHKRVISKFLSQRARQVSHALVERSVEASFRSQEDSRDFSLFAFSIGIHFRILYWMLFGEVPETHLLQIRRGIASASSGLRPWMLFFPKIAAMLPSSLARARRECQLAVIREGLDRREGTILAALAEFPEKHRWDEVVTLMASGIESASAITTWALYHSSDESEVSRASVLECLRLYPPAPIAIRYCAEPTTVLGTPVHALDYVVLSLAVALRDSRIFPAPNSYSPIHNGAGQQAEYAFGGGAHACPGRGFAIESSLTVANAVKRLARGRMRVWTRHPSPEPQLKHLAQFPPASLRGGVTPLAASFTHD